VGGIGAIATFRKMAKVAKGGKVFWGVGWTKLLLYIYILFFIFLSLSFCNFGAIATSKTSPLGIPVNLGILSPSSPLRAMFPEDPPKKVAMVAK